MPVITFQLDARISVNGTVYVFDQLSAPTGHQMRSMGSVYNTSVKLTAGNYTYKFRDGASGDWEDLIDQSCAIEAPRSGRARQLVVTTGQDSTVGPFCFGSCHACMAPPSPLAPAAPQPTSPPPVAPRDANRGSVGRRRVERSYFPVWVVFAIGGIVFFVIALAGADRRRAHRRRERDLRCKQLEPLDERFRALTLFQTSMVVAVPGAAERPRPRECALSAQSAPAADSVCLLSRLHELSRLRELELAESQARLAPAPAPAPLAQAPPATAPSPSSYLAPAIRVYICPRQGSFSPFLKLNRRQSSLGSGREPEAVVPDHLLLALSGLLQH